MVLEVLYPSLPTFIADVLTGVCDRHVFDSFPLDSVQYWMDILGVAETPPKSGCVYREIMRDIRECPVDRSVHNKKVPLILCTKEMC